MKNPSPWIARSSGFDVTCTVPSLKSGVTSETSTPKPVCSGFVPPVVLPGDEPKPCVCKNWFANWTLDCLKPTVFALEILLPATSIIVSAAFMPVRAVLSADAKPIPWFL